MKPDILRAAVDRAPAERTVTILGATGSIGASTIDLLKRERERFRVEAVSANKNAAALAALARELGARFAAIGDPAAYGELKGALSGTGIKAAAGESGLLEAAERAARSWRSPTRKRWSVLGPYSCAGRRRRAPRCCPSIRSITRSSRR